MKDATPTSTTSRSAPRADGTPDAALVLQALLHRAPVAVALLDEEGRVLDLNARAEALLNVPRGDAAGRPFGDAVDAGDVDAFTRALRARTAAGEAATDMDLGLRGRDGPLMGATFLPVQDGPARVLLVLRDLTAERHRREAAVQAQTEAFHAEHERDQKLAALGKVIAGVVHELRTPLTYSRNLIEFQRRRLADMRERFPGAEADIALALEENAEMRHGNDRAIALLHQLRPLAQNRPRERQLVDLVELAVAAAREFRGTNDTQVRLALDLQGSHAVLIVRDEILGAVLNLLRNGAQAMGGEGTLILQTRDASVPPQIRVVDHGPGVPPDVAPHLFEPFHTTKEKGTGLGLFIAKQAVEAHGGTLTHEPTPGGGATFVLQLPAAPAAHAS